MYLNMNPLRRDATNYLDDIGAFEDVGTGTYQVAAFGREYWERQKPLGPVVLAQHSAGSRSLCYRCIFTDSRTSAQATLAWVKKSIASLGDCLTITPNGFPDCMVRQYNPVIPISA